MNFSKLSSLRKHRLLGFAVGFACFLAALGARLAIDAYLPPGFPYLTFFPAVIITTVLAGLWPGITTAALSGVASWYFFIDPSHSPDPSPGVLLAMGFFTVVVAVDIAVIHIMNEALDRLAEERNRSAMLSEQARVMFSELQHRVSNNLQLVSSLIMIQQAKVKDPDARQALEDASARLTLLGSLHRKLHAPDRGRLTMSDFLSGLCRDVLDTAGAGHIRCAVEADEVDIAQEKLIPLALILTELISNALEHAFPGNRPGTVRVTLRSDGADGVTLTVQDDGVGLPAGFALARPGSLGLQLVRSLAGQLGGTLSMDTASSTVAGTVAVLRFER